MVSIGCGVDSIQATLAIAERHPDFVRVAVGVHPASAARWDQSQWPDIERLARHPQVCAIGETGLDQFRDDGTVEQQLPAMELQAALARELDLPLIIHTRAAERATLNALDRLAGDLRVVLHCFSLDAHLDEVLAHERWTCSFAGNVTYGSAGNLRAAAAAIPAGRIMVETDAPYLTPKPHRSAKNQPAYVQHTLAAVAEARGVDVDVFGDEVTRTASALFGFPLRAGQPA